MKLWKKLEVPLRGLLMNKKAMHGFPALQNTSRNYHKAFTITSGGPQWAPRRTHSRSNLWVLNSQIRGTHCMQTVVDRRGHFVVDLFMKLLIP